MNQYTFSKLSLSGFNRSTKAPALTDPTTASAGIPPQSAHQYLSDTRRVNANLVQQLGFVDTADIFSHLFRILSDALNDGQITGFHEIVKSGLFTFTPADRYLMRPRMTPAEPLSCFGITPNRRGPSRSSRPPPSIPTVTTSERRNKSSKRLAAPAVPRNRRLPSGQRAG
jgi:hypothetical protein